MCVANAEKSVSRLDYAVGYFKGQYRFISKVKMNTSSFLLFITLIVSYRRVDIRFKMKHKAIFDKKYAKRYIIPENQGRVGIW